MRPKSFFYFSSVQGDERKRWLRKLLAERLIYFRSREDLNDKNELRPNLILGGDSKSQNKYLDQIIKQYVSVPLSPAERLIKRNEFRWRFEKDPLLIEQEFHDLLGRLGVLSLSETLNADTLWGNYADRYEGVCIEFNAERGLFSAARQVFYQDIIPTVNRLEDDSETRIKKSIFTKRNAWSSECEWRVVARWHDTKRLAELFKWKNYPVELETFLLNQNGPGYYEIPADSIRAIILGPNIKSPNQEWLTSLAEELNVAHLLTNTKLMRDGSISKVSSAVR
jgi:Protein of unknown function (DUF2971)